MSNIPKEVVQEPVLGIKKPLTYLYIILYVGWKYTLEFLTFKMNPWRYLIYLRRLLIAIKGFYENKIMKINGQYKIQLYLPAFPSKPFFHALKKFDPDNKNPGPITVVFSMTKACPYKCPHCYQRNDQGPELDMALLKKTAKEMQELGVSMFDLEGGEPLVRFNRLLDLLSVFDERAEVWVNTTGYSLTEEKAQQMKAANVYGVMISLHTPHPQEYESFTQMEGSFDIATKAIKMFQKYGIVTAINFCPSAKQIRNGDVEKLFKITSELKVSLVQVIHAKPSGAWLYEKDEIFDSEELMQKLREYHHRFNEGPEASNYPSIIFQVMEEDKDHFGCTAGGIDRFYFNHEGEVQPCEFINISFGNVNEEPFLEIFQRMRYHFKRPGVKWTCCTEAMRIGEALKQNNVPKTPLPWKYTKEIIEKWDKGEETPLYKKMGIYKK